MFGQGQLGISTSSSKVESGGTTTDGPKTNSFGISVFPGVAYSLNDQIDLEAYINGLNFGYSHTNTTTQAGGKEQKDRTSQFNLGANLDNLFTTGSLNVGVIIKL